MHPTTMKRLGPTRTGLLLIVLSATVPLAGGGCAGPVADTTPPQAAAQMTPAIVATHIGLLAHPLLGGRVAGTRGNRIAGDYLADQFRQTGLAPGGDDGTFFQAFTNDRLLAAADGCSLTFNPALAASTAIIPPAGTGRPATQPTNLVAQLGRDFAPSAEGKLGAFSAPLVFAGYGLHNHTRGYNDYATLSARGAVVMILAGEPHSPSGQSKWALNGEETHLAKLPYKLRLACEQGAVAALIVTPRALMGRGRTDRVPPDDIDDVLGDCTGALPAVRITREFANRILGCTGSQGSGEKPGLPGGGSEEKRNTPYRFVSLPGWPQNPIESKTAGFDWILPPPGSPGFSPSPSFAVEPGSQTQTIEQIVERIHQTGRPWSFAIGGTLSGQVALAPAKCRNVIGVLPADAGGPADGRNGNGEKPGGGETEEERNTPYRFVPLPGDPEIQSKAKTAGLRLDCPPSARFFAAAKSAAGGDDRPVVVVGAHYDHIPATGQLARDVGPGIRPGAGDNASGDATVLTLARAMAATPGRRFTYVFIAFDSEEIGFAGSRHYVRHPLAALERVQLMVNIDEVGYVGSEGVMILGSTLDPALAKAISRASRASPLHVAAVPMTSSQRWSDQAAFVRAGVPTLFFYGYSTAARHTRLDTAERVNNAGVAATARLVYGILHRLTCSPTSTSAPETGE